jgi:hypothetical protein
MSVQLMGPRLFIRLEDYQEVLVLFLKNAIAYLQELVRKFKGIS